MDLNKFSSKHFGEVVNEILGHQSCRLDYLTSLKATRVEGMIIEHEADSAFFHPLAKNGWRKFPHTVLFCGTRDGGVYRNWFTILVGTEYDKVLLKHVTDELKKTGIPVRCLQLYPNGLVAYRHDISGAEIPVHQPLSFSTPPPAEASVLDTARVNSVFWGYAIHNEQLIEKFISDTLLKDGYVAEGYDQGQPKVFVADVDAILVSPNNEIHVVEVKHKQRTRNDEIGLNNAPRKMALQLLNANIPYIYLFLEKPVRKSISTMYLYFDRSQREIASWMACRITTDDLTRSIKSAPSHTSLTGKGKVEYASIPATRFTNLGKNYDSSDRLFKTFLDFLTGSDIRTS